MCVARQTIQPAFSYHPELAPSACMLAVTRTALQLLCMKQGWCDSQAAQQPHLSCCGGRSSRSRHPSYPPPPWEPRDRPPYRL